MSPKIREVRMRRCNAIISLTGRDSGITILRSNFIRLVTLTEKNIANLLQKAR
jgi:hypothetical protein